jgi:hypothetical protein
MNWYRTILWDVIIASGNESDVEDPDLYHVTLSAYWPSIQKHGLRPNGYGAEGNFLGEFVEQSRGKIFLCEFDGAKHLIGVLDMRARSLDLHYNVPEGTNKVIALAVPRSAVMDRQVDKVGNREMSDACYYLTRPVPPTDLRLLTRLPENQWYPETAKQAPSRRRKMSRKKGS